MSGSSNAVAQTAPTPTPTASPGAANQNQPPTPKQVADQVRADLTGGFLNPVGDDDVRRAASRITSLPADQQRQAVQDLSRDGSLDRLAAEMTDDSWIGGGLSTDQKRDFFNSMARSLGGAELAQLSAAFGKTDRQGGREDVTLLADSVARHADGAVKADYVTALAAQTTDQPYNIQGGFGHATTRQGDPEALAVSRVLGSMRGQPEALRAFEAVAADSKTLQAVIDASVGQSIVSSGGGNSVLHDPAQFTAITETLAAMRGGTPARQAEVNDLRARWFAAGASTLADVPGIDKRTTRELTEGLSRIVQADTNGVMRELAFNADTRDGGAFGAYAKAMMNSGQQETLGRMFHQLQVGNDVANPQDPIARFEQTVRSPSGELRYENAATLGYFAGGLRAAAKAITNDEKAQAENITAILKVGLTLVDKSGAGGRLVGAGAATLKEVAHFGVRAAIDHLSTRPGDTARALELAGVPSDPRTRETAVGSGSFSAYEDTTTFVERNAKP